MEIGFAHTILTPENMALKSALQNEGATVVPVNDERERFVLGSLASTYANLSGLFCRSSSLSRSLCLSYVFEAQGVGVLNSHSAQRICGDKVLCSVMLSKAGIPTPKVALAFSAQSALSAADAMGYPCVIKPPIGSWGRMVYKISDRTCAEAAIGLKDSLGHFTDKIYYVQEYVDKPGRDIRVLLIGGEIALSIARSAPTPDTFLTNLNSGGKAVPFTLSSEMGETARKVGDLLGSGIYGVDFVEGRTGEFYVLEVNHAPEFSKSAGASTKEVAQKMAKFAVSQAKG